MKTIKHTLLATATLFAVTSSFAQLGLGLTGNAGASASKTVNAAHATSRAAQVATRASAQAAVSTQKAVQSAGTRAAEAKSATATKAQTVAVKAGNAGEGLKAATPDVKAGADVRSEGRLHASGRGKDESSNGAVLNTSAQTSVSADAGVQVDKDETATPVKDLQAKTLNAKTKAEKKAAAKAERAAEKAARKKSQVEVEGREKAQASIKASENAKEHANENSAVFGAKSEVSSDATVKKEKGGVSASSNTKARAKGKVSKN